MATKDTFLAIGMDVGSTTVKATVVDPATKAILWSDYQRHHTKQPEKCLELLETIIAAFPNHPIDGWRIFLTGSGSAPLAPSTGGKFVQEVNAVTLAVEHLHPDVLSVVELGGQDAKIIMFKKDEKTGERTAMASMNDKCASGTGATIDKCMIKVGASSERAGSLRFDATRLHHVAAKCGVFAETDIVNLVKTGIPEDEILCSLADAIVMQNLSVLTRGSTLLPKVLLLGGPNTYLPFLQDCWRLRIPQVWAERGFTPPEGMTAEELILIPPRAELYAAYGAVAYGLAEPASRAGTYAGLDALAAYCADGRKARLAGSAGPALVASASERESFEDAYRTPRFAPVRFEAGARVRAAIGLDGGSTSSKAVLLDEDGRLLRKAYTLSKGNPIEDMRTLLASLRDGIEADGATLDVIGFGATGYAADVLTECLRSDVNVVETVAHMLSAKQLFGDVDVVCDIGGQDIKVLFLANGDIDSFKLSNQCSAGNGMLLQAMADQFGLPVTEYADAAFAAELAPKFSYGCAVFLDTDRVTFQKEGYSKEELLAGLAQVLPKNVWQYVVGIPRLAALGRRFVLQGGTQYNLAAVKAQVDYIKARVPDAEVFVHPHSGEAGAIGAALETLRVVARRGSSSFIGLEAAVALRYETKNDESTTCHFCPNECSRTFIDAYRPDGTTSRYIAGFSCEKGTVESEEAMLALVKERKALAQEHPNLVDLEGKRLFSVQRKPRALPEAGSATTDAEITRTFWGSVVRRAFSRGFERSGGEARERRARVRIGLPRVLNMYSTGPFFTTYLLTLGLDKRNIVWSDETTEELWLAGGKYGSVDPCFPSKVVQAHIHQLLFEKHAERPLDAIFFPILTHVPSFVTHAVDYASCPIVAGTPDVVKAAFTKEKDYFAERGIRYLAPALPFTERTLLARRLFETFGELLGVTEDESDFAVGEGLAALEELDRDLQTRGRAILDEVEETGKIAVLLLGRPYHLDPGLHHGIPDELQLLGYPILTTRSIPKDPAWLARFFADDLASGRVRDALEIGDVWPENYSANSAQKVWAAKLAARHPNIVLLDISSFKCGHDAPTYGIIEGIVSASATPQLAMHDLDANKPGGSIKIRTRTYAYSLSRHEEALADVVAKKRELAQRIDEKRLALLREKAARGAPDATLAAEIERVATRVRAYAPAPPPPEPPKGLIRLGKKTVDGAVVRLDIA